MFFKAHLIMEYITRLFFDEDCCRAEIEVEDGSSCEQIIWKDDGHPNMRSRKKLKTTHYDFEVDVFKWMEDDDEHLDDALH